MSAEKSAINKGRRQFLNGSALVGAGAVAAAVIPAAAVAATDDDQAGQESTKPVNENYRLTKHIQDYYKTVAS